MTIAKGLIDKSGNSTLIQGAGTTYNEGLNSIAIGEGTVAAGVNQFVFGKYNKTEDNKVEVVGAGTKAVKLLPSDVDKFARTPIGTEVTINWIGDIWYNNATITILAKTLEEFNEIVEDTVEVESYHSEVEEVLFFGILTSINVDIMKYWYFYRHKSTQEIKVMYTNIGYINQVPKRYVFTAGYGGYPISSITTHTPTDLKNIRTLDWEGNQMLAGKLDAFALKINKDIEWNNANGKRTIATNEALLIPHISRVDVEEITLNGLSETGTLVWNCPNKDVVKEHIAENKACTFLTHSSLGSKNYVAWYPQTAWNGGNMYVYKACEVDESGGYIYDITYIYKKDIHTNTVFIVKTNVSDGQQTTYAI
jgi:hypothetical protein